MSEIYPEGEDNRHKTLRDKGNTGQLPDLDEWMINLVPSITRQACMYPRYLAVMTGNGETTMKTSGEWLGWGVRLAG